MSDTWVTFMNGETELHSQEMGSVPRNGEYVLIEEDRYVVTGTEWDLRDPDNPYANIWVVPQ